jgi:hypothetical protein
MDSASGFTSSGSPSAAARSDMVLSSYVGPRPPVETTRSTLPAASLNTPADSSSSGEVTILLTMKPSDVNFLASHPALVFSTSPSRTSFPSVTIHARGAMCAEPFNRDICLTAGA